MKKLFSILIIISVMFFGVASAQVMQSGNFQIELESMNTGGGYSASTLYITEDTVGEVGSGLANSPNFSGEFGYQAVNDSYISISSESDVVLGNLSGLLGGTSTATTTWTVSTDNPFGYSLYLRATSSPALASQTSSFSDHATSSASFTFNNLSASSTFGFSPEGADIISSFKDDGSTCGTGSLDTIAACFSGFSTQDMLVAERSHSAHPLGATTTIRFQAVVGPNILQEPGTYNATIIVTALSL